MISQKPFGASLDISSVAESLLVLAREALPRDSLLQNTALPPHIPVPLPSPSRSIVVAHPDGELPNYGEYVYVEELPEAVEKRQPAMPPAAREAVSRGEPVAVWVGVPVRFTAE